MRAGVMGNCNILTPTASKSALATTAPIVMIGGSPQLCAAKPGLSIRIVSIFGNQE